MLVTIGSIGWKADIRPAFRKWLYRAIIPAKHRIERLGMRRRNFMTILVGVAAYPLSAGAQQKAMPVIGFLHSASSEPAASTVAAFRQGLGETGYVEGQNVAIEYRWAEGHYDRLPTMAADLVDRKVDLIVAAGGIPSVFAAKNATSTIPIIFTSVGYPVAAGLVTSFARPGGNVTGFSILAAELTPKRFDLLSEMVPGVRLVGLLVNPNNVNTELVIRDSQEAARTKGLNLHILTASAESDIDAPFATLVERHVGGLVVGADPFFFSRREQIVALAARHAVPAIYELREYTMAGGLMSYGPSVAANYRQAGIYVGKILHGAKPTDLPVQQPTTFELVVNLKTAKALGLAVPPSVLARADEVIE
jgi:putative ABC transport system substrate-binding protein